MTAYGTWSDYLATKRLSSCLKVSVDDFIGVLCQACRSQADVRCRDQSFKTGRFANTNFTFTDNT
jgi:hypothetical protein